MPPADHTLKVSPITIALTGTQFMNHARRYFDAAEVLRRESTKSEYDPVLHHLLCQSLELNLKAFLWLMDRPERNKFRTVYGHNLVKMWNHAKEKGIHRYCSLTPLRDEIIAFVGPFYKDRKFVYADVGMWAGGMKALREKTTTIPTLRRLCAQLLKSLKRDVYNASVS